MSEALEVAERAWRAFQSGGLDAYMESFAPDVTWRAIEGAPDDVGEMHGREAVRRYIEDWIEMFDELTNVPEELTDLGDGRVLSVNLVRGRARGSGIETELRYAIVSTVRDGLIVSGREYADRESAVAAAGSA